MRAVVWRHDSSLLIAALLMAAPLLGYLVVESPLVGVTVVIAAALLVGATYLTNEAAMRTAAFAVCAAVIMYPAFLPRRSGISVAFGGDFGPRAQVQLVVILGLVLAAVWLWLSTPGTVAALRRAPLNYFAVYGGIVLVSLLYTPDKTWAAYAALKLFQAFLVVGVLAVLVRSTEHLKQLINVMLAATAVVMLVYLFDVVSGNAVPDNVARPTTRWIHANGASIITFTFAVIMAARFFTAPSRRAARTAGLLMCFGALVGFIAGGKTALAGAVVAVFLILVVTMIKQPSRFKFGRLMLIGLGLVAVLAIVASLNVGIAAHLRIYTEDEYRNAADLTGRVPVWQAAIQGGLERPIWGHGYMSTFAIGLEGRFWTAGQAHNTFVQTFFDLGLVGLVAMLAIYAGAWWSVLRQSLRRGPPDDRWRLSVQLLGGLAILSVDSLAETPFGGIFEIVTMLFIVIVFAIHQNARVNGADRVVHQP